VWWSAFVGEEEASWLQETKELGLAMVGGGELVVGGKKWVDAWTNMAI
jgi:hypothetical protein